MHKYCFLHRPLAASMVQQQQVQMFEAQRSGFCNRLRACLASLFLFEDTSNLSIKVYNLWNCTFECCRTTKKSSAPGDALPSAQMIAASKEALTPMTTWNHVANKTVYACSSFLPAALD
jgi:hypothetical protein